MSYLVINLTAFTQFPDVVTADGKKTSIRLFPKARTELPTGATVDSNWQARNPTAIKVVKLDRQDKGRQEDQTQVARTGDK